MMVVASKADDVIPFPGVQKYVHKLQCCVQQHKRLKGHHKSFENSPSAVGTLPRGTVLFDVDSHYGHFGSANTYRKFMKVRDELYSDIAALVNVDCYIQRYSHLQPIPLPVIT